MIRRLLLILTLLALAPAAWAQSFPAFDDKGVVDAANLLDPAQEQALSARLIAQKKASGRSLVVATIPDLQGYDIADYGYRLGRAWGIGNKDSNGAVLIIAPKERKVRIEVGYGLEGVLTDALSSQIVRNAIAPRFKAGDMPGGINAGVDEITTLLALPPDQAKQRAAQAEEQVRRQDDGGGGIIAFWIILFIVFFVILPLLSRAKGGKRYRRGSGSAPIIIWGPGAGSSGWGSGGGWGGSSWGGGDSGGGFSGGGSFGGGGASGDW
ncbi:TPM domain-containing protein [Sphingobium sp. HBC34]|uniref:TPM domain-containing protein n=1 Tax=Sphingobium cyanobacteriorum TaxID=3063954 RepID=A0ABT8ZNC6_9SPHN|nr:TPM domain-containing protein [Sphingobium sp. HBC34]MDO7836040.1 TPM domain-containing protein [Sphingobium sp. HBC34]